jgi:hypothetical protein
LTMNCRLDSKNAVSLSSASTVNRRPSREYASAVKLRGQPNQSQMSSHNSAGFAEIVSDDL